MSRAVATFTRKQVTLYANVLADLLDARASAHDGESDCHALLGRLEKALVHAHAGDECRAIARALRAERDMLRISVLGRPKRRTRG